MEQKYYSLLSKYPESSKFSEKFFREIEEKYNQKQRYYHNFQHINNMLEFSINFQTCVSNYDDLLFSIWYHDVIYNPLSKTNERDSAKLARKHLSKFKYKNLDIVFYLIERTSNHGFVEKNEIPELQFLLDLDLMTLGSEPEIYKQNSNAIRKEYGVIPDMIFFPGRAKFIESLLKTKQIYRTRYFEERFEEQARKNLQNELDEIKAK